MLFLIYIDYFLRFYFKKSQPAYGRPISWLTVINSAHVSISYIY